MTSPRTPEPLSFPVETEIIIQSDGRVVVADLPVELAKLVAELQGNIDEAAQPLAHAEHGAVAEGIDSDQAISAKGGQLEADS